MTSPASDPLVSVAIPTRGRPAWCEEAVRSALAQTGVAVEVVVAIDGEDAETRARLEAIGDPRVRVVAQAAAGRSATRNRAWRETRGARIAFLDDDDVLTAGSLAARSAAMDAHPGAMLAHGLAIAMDAAGRPLRAAPRAGRGRAPTSYDALVSQSKGRSLLPSTVLVARTAIERAGGFAEDLPTGEDWLLFLRLSAAGPFVAVDAPVVRYRKHEGQVRWDPAQQEAALPLLIARWFDAPDTPARARPYRARLEARLLAYIARNYRRLGRTGDADRCLRVAVAGDRTLLLHPRRLRNWLGAVLLRRGAGS